MYVMNVGASHYVYGMYGGIRHYVYGYFMLKNYENVKMLSIKLLKLVGFFA